jgi:integrase
MSDQWRRGKHRGAWCGVIGTGDSRRRAALYTVQGKRITNDAKEADAAIRRLNADTERALMPATLSMDQVYGIYERKKDGKVANFTRIQEVGRVCKRLWGSLSPDEITPEEVERFVKVRRREGCSNSTIRQELAYISAALGVSKKHIGQLPTIEKPPPSRPRERWLTEYEIVKLIDGAFEFHVKLFIVLAITTAGRPKHILQLTWDRVDMERRVINLDNYEERTRKGRARVPINDTALQHLTLAREAAQTEWVIEVDGHPIKSIRNGVKAAARRASLGGVSQYVLRHTAGVRMAHAGVPLEQIAEFMGHTDLNTTRKHYARYHPEHLRQAATALEIGK